MNLHDAWKTDDDIADFILWCWNEWQQEYKVEYRPDGFWECPRRLEDGMYIYPEEHWRKWSNNDHMEFAHSYHSSTDKYITHPCTRRPPCRPT